MITNIFIYLVWIFPKRLKLPTSYFASPINKLGAFGENRTTHKCLLKLPTLEIGRKWHAKYAERTLRTPSTRRGAQFATQSKIRYAHT